MNYNEYLKTKHWRETRNKFKSKTWNRCFICRNKDSVLDVHHKRYKRYGSSILFNEKHNDLRLLCRDCHIKIHRFCLEEILAKNIIKRTKLRDLLRDLCQNEKNK